jgi:hypothetical protein
MNPQFAIGSIVNRAGREFRVSKYAKRGDQWGIYLQYSEVGSIWVPCYKLTWS